MDSKSHFTKNGVYFKFTGPVCAEQCAPSRKVDFCSTCGRAMTTRIADLSVKLKCKDQSAIQVLGGLIIVSDELRKKIELGNFEKIDFRSVHVEWDEQSPWVRSPLKTYWELSPLLSVSASERSLEREDCVCNQVKRINQNPLFIISDSRLGETSARSLVQNTDITVFGEKLYQLIKRHQSELHGDEVYVEQEFEARVNSTTHPELGNFWRDTE